MIYLEELIKFEGTSREIVTQNLGSFIFDYFKPPAWVMEVTLSFNMFFEKELSNSLF